jgi:hypothetical protein
VNTFRHRGFGWIVLALPIMLASLFSQPLRAQTSAPSNAALSGASQPGGELKTVAVVAVAPYEKLISDITALGELIGRPEAGQMVEGGFAFFTQGKGPDALDKKQPWGVIVQTDGAAFLPVGCLPVTKADAVLDVATALGVQLQQAEDGVNELVLPNQKTVFLKQQAGWAFVSLSRDALSRLPENPQATLAPLVSEYDVAARVSMKDVPEMYRQFAVQMMQAGVQQQMQQRDDESDEQYELRQKMTEAQMAQTARTLNETDSLTFGWAIDAAQKQTYVDFSQTFLPGSKMAQQIAAYDQPRTNFAGFYQPDSAATVSFTTKADPELLQQDIAQFETMMRAMRAQLNKAIDDNEDLADEAEARETLKAAAGDFIDAFEDTIEAGHIDGGAALHLGPDSLTLVAGALVKDPAKIESALKKVEQAAQQKKDSEYTGIKWNAANHGGVAFHTLTVPVPEDEEAPRKLLGSELNIAVGIGAHSVYLAIGKDNLNAVQRAIDASAAEPDKAVPPFALSVSLGPIMAMAAEQAEESDQKAIVQHVAEMLQNEAQDHDHIRAVGKIIPNGLRYRFAAEEGVLRAIGTATTEAQRRALQANQ